MKSIQVLVAVGGMLVVPLLVVILAGVVALPFGYQPGWIFQTLVWIATFYAAPSLLIVGLANRYSNRAVSY